MKARCANIDYVMRPAWTNTRRAAPDCCWGSASSDAKGSSVDAGLKDEVGGDSRSTRRRRGRQLSQKAVVACNGSVAVAATTGHECLVGNRFGPLAVDEDEEAEATVVVSGEDSSHEVAVDAKQSVAELMADILHDSQALDVAASGSTVHRTLMAARASLRVELLLQLAALEAQGL